MQNPTDKNIVELRQEIGREFLKLFELRKSLYNVQKLLDYICPKVELLGGEISSIRLQLKVGQSMNSQIQPLFNLKNEKFKQLSEICETFIAHSREKKRIIGEIDFQESNIRALVSELDNLEILENY